MGKSIQFSSLRSMAKGLVRILGRHWLRLGLAGVLFAAAFSVQRSIHADPTFLVRHFDVQTTGRLDKARILAWSGLWSGMNIFDINLGAVERRLVRHPQIKLARVTRTMPNRIGIFVSERRPFVQLSAKEKDRTFWFLDEEGYVVPSRGPRVSAHIPRVVDPELASRPLEVGKQYENPRFLEIKRLLKILSQSSLIPSNRLSHIVARPEGHYVLVLTSGLQVLIQDDFHAALAKLDHFREEFRLQKSDIEYIDVRFTDVAIRRKREKS